MSWLLLEGIAINSKHIVAIVNQPNAVNVIIAKSVLYNGVKTKCITVKKESNWDEENSQFKMLLEFLNQQSTPEAVAEVFTQ